MGVPLENNICDGTKMALATAINHSPTTETEDEPGFSGEGRERINVTNASAGHRTVEAAGFCCTADMLLVITTQTFRG
ncbi:MAG TPA: hypothetical protein VHV29_20040 [Terriglobales bacterium]|nr:hypothetical protein [Terriglobales bacterium]